MFITRTIILVNGHRITGTGELRGSGRGETEEVIAFRTEGTPGFPAGEQSRSFREISVHAIGTFGKKGTEGRK